CSDLSALTNHIASKYFYDEAGAELFKAITATPEYYPTRSELAILRENASDIARLLPARSAVIEFGSGSTEKARVLLAAAPQGAAYVPVDISSEMLAEEAKELQCEWPNLLVSPIHA